MNWKHTAKLLFVGLLTAAFALAVACGDDPSGTENQDNQDNQNQNQNQNQNDDTPEEAPTCEDADPPERCEASPDDFADFGPGSHVTKLEIADEDCCVDFTDGGDGDPDNGLADLLELAENFDISREDLNDDIQESINDGDIAIVFEHEGLVEFEAGQEFQLNFLLGSEVDGGEATIDPASFEEGTHPHALIPGAELDDSDVLTAGPGTMILSLDIGALTGGEVDLDLDLTISEAQLTADAAASADGVDGGVYLENGELGGLLLIEDIVDALNDFAVDCECLDHPDPLIHMEGGDPQTVQCDEAIEEQDGDELEEACEDNDEDLCGALGANCGMVSFVGVAADIDSNDDGIPDAASVGLRLGADAVVITGVAAE